MPTPSDPPPIVISDLCKSFDKKKVLNGVSLTVAHGETVAVLGRSGTGKSVLLKLIIGLEPPDSGTIRILNEEIAGLDTEHLNEIRKKIGFLFQQGALYDSLTVEQNVAFPLVRHAALSEADRKDRVRVLLESVGLAQDDFRKMPSEISGGMQKRVGLARALALKPEILLCDEPTSGLDPITASEVGKLISKLQRERAMTSIVVTHDIHGARAFADRMVVLHEGSILTEGTFEELQRSGNPFVTRFLRDAA
jgi:phospholipid/cholesterol/gamma-HCH transport system ATP-binding protein